MFPYSSRNFLGMSRFLINCMLMITRRKSGNKAVRIEMTPYHRTNRTEIQQAPVTQMFPFTAASLLIFYFKSSGFMFYYIEYDSFLETSIAL
jgi:hypothetical protein